VSEGKLTSRLLIAPTEPPPIKTLGRVSSLPEKFGVDVMWVQGGRKIGVQRKEVGDLLSSVADGRLGKEIAQMGSGGVVGLLVVEGRMTWSVEGELLGEWGRPWTKAGMQGLMWSVMAKGVAVAQSDGVAGTVEMIGMWERWTAKDHGTLDTRPGKPASMWGQNPSGEEWQAWVLQGFPGIGPELAKRVVRKFGGLPWKWRVGKGELMEVEGLGKKKVEKMWKMVED